MTLDAGAIVSLALVLVFIGFIVGAELHSRRLRRKNVEQQAAPRDATDEESRHPSKKV